MGRKQAGEKDSRSLRRITPKHNRLEIGLAADLSEPKENVGRAPLMIRAPLCTVVAMGLVTLLLGVCRTNGRETP